MQLVYATKDGDRLINEIAHFFYIDNPACLAACRTGCDQFRGIFDVSGLSHDEEVNRVVEKNECFEALMAEKYPNVFIHVYTGLYFLEDGEMDVRVAIDKAHVAKKLSKGKFNIKCQVYDPADFKQQTDQMAVVNQFVHACDNDGILVYLQPKYSVSKDCVVGAEALVRMADDDGGIIPPGRFIPVLEATGMISKLDELMIEKIFDLQKNGWKKAGRFFLCR